MAVDHSIISSLNFRAATRASQPRVRGTADRPPLSSSLALLDPPTQTDSGRLRRPEDSWTVLAPPVLPDATASESRALLLVCLPTRFQTDEVFAVFRRPHRS